MPEIPIVFIHQGDSSYLQYTLKQAIKNGNSEVILIGDEANNRYPFVQHLKISDFSEGANAFAQVYKHLSFNPYGYTMFSTQRWFILKEFMQKMNIPQCFYQDSDNMLYMNVTNIQKRFSQYEFAMFPTGHMAFINSLPLLEMFCEFAMQYYTDPLLFRHLLECRKQGEVIHDQKLFELFYAKTTHPLKSFYGLEIFDESTFDSNINLGLGYEETIDNRRKMYAIKNKLYGRHLESNRFIEFLTLQFQGEKAKKFIPFFTQEVIQRLRAPSYFDYSSCKWIRLNQAKNKSRLSRRRLIRSPRIRPNLRKNTKQENLNINQIKQKRVPGQNRNIRTISKNKRRTPLRNMNPILRNKRLIQMRNINRMLRIKRQLRRFWRRKFL